VHQPFGLMSPSTALQDFGDMLKGRRLAPVDLFDAARKSLHFVGYEGLSMIAASGLDMAAWDALAKAANQPLCVLLGVPPHSLGMLLSRSVGRIPSPPRTVVVGIPADLLRRRPDVRAAELAAQFSR